MNTFETAAEWNERQARKLATLARIRSDLAELSRADRAPVRPVRAEEVTVAEQVAEWRELLSTAPADLPEARRFASLVDAVERGGGATFFGLLSAELTLRAVLNGAA